MRKKIALVIIILSLLSLSFVFCADNRSFRTAIVSNESSHVLPYDSKIGQLCDVNQTIYHEFLLNALSHEYSIDWIQTYLQEDVRSALVSMYDSFFASNLPFDSVLMSTLYENADNSIGINVRTNSTCISFIIKDEKIIAMKVLD